MKVSTIARFLNSQNLERNGRCYIKGKNWFKVVSMDNKNCLFVVMGNVETDGNKLNDDIETKSFIYSVKELCGILKALKQ